MSNFVEYFPSITMSGRTDALLMDEVNFHDSSIDKKSTFESINARSFGNEIFKDEMHNKFICQKVLSYYNKSVAYALSNTEELAFGYSNRSLLLHHIKQYDFSLLDIDQALSITKSPKLKVKLLARKISCLRALHKNPEKLVDPVCKLAEQFINEVEDKKINQQLNDILKKTSDVRFDWQYKKIEMESIPDPEMSSVDLKYNKTFGRHLTVNRDVPPGQMLLIEETYIRFPTLEKVYLVCTNCLNFAWTAVPCDHCPCVVFCSDFCKKDAWNQYHDIECLLLQRLNHKEDFDMRIFMQYRSFIMALKDKDFQFNIDHAIKEFELGEENFTGITKDFLKNKFRALCSLESNEENMKKMYGHLTHGRIDFLERRALITLKIFRQIFLSKLKMTEKQYDTEFVNCSKWNKLKLMLKRIYCIITINDFWVSTDEIEDSHDAEEVMQGLEPSNAYASVVALFSSLINHNCNFNASRAFQNGKMVVFSIRPLKKDEQIFISYGVGLSTNWFERKNYLKHKYFFDCNCLSCTKNFTISSIWKTREENDLIKWLEILGNKLRNKCHGSAFQLRKRQIPFVRSKIVELYKKSDGKLKAWIYEQYLQHLHWQVYGQNFVIAKCC